MTHQSTESAEGTKSGDIRRHGFELLATELRVYTGAKVTCYRITPEQIMKLQHQASTLIYSLYNLVLRR